MSHFEEKCQLLRVDPKVWVITGVAGFIGSNLLEFLLKLDQEVIGLDNFSTGYESNLDEVKSLVNRTQWDRFRFVKGNINDYEISKRLFLIQITSCIRLLSDLFHAP